MGKAYIVLLTAILLSLCACAAKTADPHDSVEDNGVYADFAPLMFSSFEEFHAGLREAKSNAKSAFVQESELQIAQYNFAEIAGYYIPDNLPQGAALDSIRVKGEYVALYYTMDAPITDAVSASGSALNELLTTVMFEWTRSENGQALLDYTIQNESLISMGGDPEVFYSDVGWPSDPQTVLGRQYYWLEDGYLFSYYLPLTEVNKLTVSDTKAKNGAVNIDQFLSASVVEIPAS